MKKVTLFIIVIVSLISNGAVSFAQFGTISTVVGSVAGGYSGDGGLAVNAEIYNPYGVATDTAGNYYIADYFRIRKVSRSGIITTIAGNGTGGSSGDGGPALSAQIGGGWGVNCIATDRAGNVYFGEEDRVRKINTAGIVTTVAGNGTDVDTGDGRPADSAGVYFNSIAVDDLGNIYVSCWVTVRKVNATSGIISTVAGNGTWGFSGDGGPAIAAQFHNALGIAVDNVGNLYVADSGNGRIRMINTSGIITTIAGNGAGGSHGDCGPATLASLSGPGGVCVDAANNVYILEQTKIRKINAISGIIRTIAGTGVRGYSGDNGPSPLAEIGDGWAVASAISVANNSLFISDVSDNVIRKITLTNTSAADSFSYVFNKLCSGANISFLINSYSAAQTIKTYYGDGSVDSIPVSSGLSGHGVARTIHAYSVGGTYTVKHILRDGTLDIDSISYSYEYKPCNILPVKFYYDALGTCAYVSGSDPFITNPNTIEVDSNSVAIDTISAPSGFYYIAYGSAGDIYSFKLIPSPYSYPTACPASGTIADTLQAEVDSAGVKYLGFECGASTNFDLAVDEVIPVAANNAEEGYIYVRNYDCYPANPIVKLFFSPKYVYGNAFPAPTLVSGNSITWDLAALSADNPTPLRVVYYLNYNPSTGLLAIGDTVQEHVSVSPIIGDTDPSNNTEMVIDSVIASLDPNEMWVTPQGYIPADTLLQYTINFENTGTDTAFNIYVMDTLSDNVNISSLRITSTSNVMNITKLYDNIYHNIIRFDFPNINLLDSSHHGQCDGYVAFNIHTKSGLATGTTIFNQAGIFFDSNPVVMTNTVEDIVGTPPVSTKAPIVKSHPASSVTIYPNPTTEELTIKTNQNTYTSFTITNTIGQQLMQQPITGTQTLVNVKALSPGVYYIMLKDDNGSKAMKFVKW